MNSTIETFLSQRASVRQFDPEAEMSAEQIEQILELAATAPSGNNTQPWQVVVVKNKAQQQKLRALSFDQPQVETAAAVFLVFGDPAAYDVDTLFAYNVANGLLTEKDEAAFKGKMKKFYALSEAEGGTESLMLDGGLFAMNLLHAVRVFGYEAVPMRGTDFTAIKKELDLPQSWEPIMMIPVGKATASGYPKIRKDVTEFTKIIE